MTRCDLCWNTKEIKQFLTDGQYCPEHYNNMERYHLQETIRHNNYKLKLASNCYQHIGNKDSIDKCFRCINKYCSEFYLCESCYKEQNIENKGIIRYDSLVQCKQHNEQFKPIVKKLYQALGVIEN